MPLVVVFPSHPAGSSPWRAGLRIQEALVLSESDRRPRSRAPAAARALPKLATGRAEECSYEP